MPNIKELFSTLLEGLVDWNIQEITYNNNEKLISHFCYYNNYKITFHDNRISTIFKEIPQTYREHSSLESVVKEISEQRLSFGAFTMF